MVSPNRQHAYHFTREFEERVSQQDDEIKRIMNLFKIDGELVFEKEATKKDKVKKKLCKTILFLLDFITEKANEALTSIVDTEIKKNESIIINIEEEDSSEISESKEPKPNCSKSIEETQKIKIEKENTCLAFKLNVCPNMKNDTVCPNRHPQKCQKFCQYGHIEKDGRGCDTQSCSLLHPKLCRNSIKSRECPYKNCKFQHLNGTKIIQKKGYLNAGNVRKNQPNKYEGKFEFLVNNIDKLIGLISMFENVEHEASRSTLGVS